MSNKINNPLLKQLIAEIAGKANQGRINDLSWGAIYEAKKPTAPAEEPAAAEAPAAGAAPAPAAGAAPAAPAAPDAGVPPAAPEADGEAPPAPDAEGGDDSGEEDPEQAKQDAIKAKADLEKAKAEKAAAEKEIKQHKYVKLSSSTGTQFLLGKIVDHAFKSGEIDSLASELVEKLNIKTPEAMNLFAKDVTTYMSIPGMPELVSSMRTMATKEPEESEEPAA